MPPTIEIDDNPTKRIQSGPDGSKLYGGISSSMTEEITEENIGWKFWKRRRYLVAFLAFLGFFNVYALRVNLSVAIVAMTENKTQILPNGTTVILEPEFNWDSTTQGIILASFFYGYIFTQLPGGYFAAKIGGNKVFGMGIAATSVLTLLTPFFAHSSLYLLIAVRIVEGLFEGVTFPCIHAVWARWAPPLERSRLATIAFSGSYVGTVVSMPVCGILATNFGWESIFYIFGVVGLIWFAVWVTVVKESPHHDPHITKSELRYLKSKLGSLTEHNSNIQHPWKKIFTSGPVWAIVVSHFSENWGFYTMLTQLPTFMKDAHGFELEKAGFLSALPYLAMSIFIQFSGQLADRLQEKKILTTTQVRKLFNCGAFLFQTVFMISAAYWLTPFGTMVCLTLSIGLGAFAWSGFSVNHLDIAPQHASVIMGFGNTFATIPGIVSPTITGLIVQKKSPEEWKYVFFIAGGIYLVGCVVYGLLASGERQEWAMDDLKENGRKRESGGKDNPGFLTS